MLDRPRFDALVDVLCDIADELALARRVAIVIPEELAANARYRAAAIDALCDAGLDPDSPLNQRRARSSAPLPRAATRPSGP